jgi:hypothetical protein
MIPRRVLPDGFVEPAVTAHDTRRESKRGRTVLDIPPDNGSSQ